MSRQSTLVAWLIAWLTARLIPRVIPRLIPWLIPWLIASSIAGFLCLNLILCSSAVLARSAGESNRFIACTANDAAGFLSLDCSERQALPAPQISYLPGEDGETILVADFEGVAWDMPARVIRVSSGPTVKGIKEIRVCRLQESPPICRISVITTDLRALKSLNFKTVPGRLEMRWPVIKSSSVRSSYSNLTSAAAKSPVERYLPVPMTSADMTVTNAPPATLRPAPALATLRPTPAVSSTVAPHPAKGASVRALATPIADSAAESTWSSSDLFQGKSDRKLDRQSNTRARPASGPESGPESGNDNEPVADLRPAPIREPANRYLASKTMPPLAPPLSRNRMANAGTSNPTATATATPTSNPTPNPTPTPAARSVALPYVDPDDPGSGATANYDTPPPSISLTFEQDPSISSTINSANNFSIRVNVTSSHSLAFNTFRLSNPDRYVMDFTNCPELVAAQLPDVSANDFVHSIRVGKIDGSGKTRLVIDLLNDAVAIKEQVQHQANLVSIVISRTPTLVNPIVDKNFQVQPGTTIVLDAGHGGTDPGAQRGDVQEKEITLYIVDKLRKLLLAKGFKVIMTRSDDTFVSLEDRVRITNSMLPDLFLSVHINAMESANDIHGIETYYQTEQSRDLADAVHENLVNKLEAPDKGVRKARFFVINHTSVPAILAEVGFISNKDERDKLISSDYQKQIAEALGQGVMLFLDRQLASKQTDRALAPSRLRASAQVGTLPNLTESNDARIAQRKTSVEESAR